MGDLESYLFSNLALRPFKTICVSVSCRCYEFSLFLLQVNGWLIFDETIVYKVLGFGC